MVAATAKLQMVKRDSNEKNLNKSSLNRNSKIKNSVTFLLDCGILCI